MVAWLLAKFGHARALELAVGGQPTTGAELAARGVALRAVPDVDVVAEARAYSDLLATNHPAAMAGVKATLRALGGVPPERFREAIRAAQETGQAADGRGPGTGLRGR